MDCKPGGHVVGQGCICFYISLFSPMMVTIIIYNRTSKQKKLGCWLKPRGWERGSNSSHPSTNRVRCRLTTLIVTNALALHQTATIRDSSISTATVKAECLLQLMFETALKGDHSRLDPVQLVTIRYNTRCYFNVRSKADMSQLNLPHVRV